MKKQGFAAIAVALLLLLTACSAATSNEAYDSGAPEMPQFNGSAGMEDNKAEAMPEDMPSEDMTVGDGGGMAELPDGTERKLIKNADYRLETLEYDKTIAAIEKLVQECEGYIQNSSESGVGAVDYGYVSAKNASFTVRIPASDFDNFKTALGQCGSLTYSYQYIDEVTNYYYDTAARLNSLRIREERLLELVAEADGLDAIVTLEAALAEVRYEIESNEGILRRLDSQVSYSTINIEVQEVFEPSRIQPVPKTLGQRIAQRFASTWDDIVDGGEDFLVFLVGDCLLILFWIVIIVAVFLLLRRGFRKLRRKKKGGEIELPPTDEDVK